MAGDAQFIIDVAAQMTGGDATTAQLDSLTKGLANGGKEGLAFQEAAQRVSQSLDQAKIASTAANAALANGEQAYKQAERAANKLAKAAERAAVKNKGVVPEAMQARLQAANVALRTQARSMDQLQESAQRATREQEKFGDALTNVNNLSRRVKDNLGDTASKVSTFRGALGDVGGPLGELGERALFPIQAFVDLNEWFGKTAAISVIAVIGLAAVAAATVVLTIAAAAVVVKLTAMAISLANTAREAELATDAFNAMNPALDGITDSFGEVTTATGVTSDRLQDLSLKLKDAKVSAEDLPAALEAAATAEAALGQGGADEFIKSMKEGKLSAAEFANTVDDKFGNVVARKMLGLEAQGARFKRNIGELFSGVDIEPFLQGLSTLVGLFESGTAAGDTMKFLFEELFQPIIDGVTAAIPVVEAFFLGILIGALKIFIALKPAMKAIAELFGFEDESFMDLLTDSKEAGEAFAFVLVGLAGAFGLVVAVGASIIAVMIAIPVAIATVARNVVELGSTILETLGGIDLFELGSNMMKGLVKGVTSAAGFVKDAVSNAVKNAIASAKSLLGISSPSKVFAGFGSQTGQGFVAGVDAENDNAQSALESMVAPPAMVAEPAVVQASGGASKASAGDTSSKGSSINLEGATFVFQGVEGSEDAEARFTELLTRLLEGDVTQLGGAKAA